MLTVLYVYWNMIFNRPHFSSFFFLQTLSTHSHLNAERGFNQYWYLHLLHPFLAYKPDLVMFYRISGGHALSEFVGFSRYIIIYIETPRSVRVIHKTSYLNQIDDIWTQPYAIHRIYFFQINKIHILILFHSIINLYNSKEITLFFCGIIK